MEVSKQYQIEISNRFGALENLSDGEDINRAWEIVKEIIKISAKESLVLHELKQHKPWFDEECLDFLDQRKQAKIQWMQDPSQSTIENLDNARNIRMDLREVGCGCVDWMELAQDRDRWRALVSAVTKLRVP